MRNYATFDETNLDATLVLSEGDNILAPASTSTIYHMARSTIAQDYYPSSVECMVFSPDGTEPTLNGQVLVGVMFEVVEQEAEDRFVGQDFFSFAYRHYDGKIWNAGTWFNSLQFSSATYGDYIRLEIDPPSGALSIYKNGNLLGVVQTGYSGQAWKYCASVAGSVGQRAVWMNSGIVPMKYPGGSVPGWWEPAPTIPSMLFGSEYFIGKALDDWTPPYAPFAANEKYDGAVTADITLYDSLHFTPWGASAPAELGSGGLVQVQISDPKRKYDDLLSDAARGAPFPVMRAQSNASIDDAENIFTGVLDHAEQTDLYHKTVYARDQRQRLLVPLRRALYAPNLDKGVAAKPRSISLGACRTYAPDYISPLTYAASDCAITGIGYLRVGGKILPFAGGSAVLTPDATGFILTDQPSAMLTLETTSQGTAYDAGAADYLDGDGDFLTCNYDTTYYTPDYWEVYAADGTVAADAINSSGHRISDGSVTDRFWVNVAGTQKVECIAGSYQVRCMKSDITIKAYRTYAFSLKITRVPKYGTFGSGSQKVTYPAARLYFGSQKVSGQNLMVSNAYLIDGAGEGIMLDVEKTYSGFFTNQFDSDKPLYLIIAFNPKDNTTLPLNDSLRIESLFLNETAAISQNMVLDAPGINGMLRGLMVDRGPLEPEEYISADAEAIDADIGYKFGIHVRSSESPLVEQCVQQVLDSSLCDIYNDDDGKFRTIRLFAPEGDGVTVQGTLTRTHMLSDLLRYPDLAENLTTRVSGCRNWDPISFNDADVTYTDVPAADRAKLSADYQWTVTAGIELAQRYRDAYNRAALATILDEEADGQDLVRYLNTLYKSARNFYVGNFHWPFVRKFQLGHVWNIVYPMYGLEAGQKLLIVGRQRQPTQEQCKLIWWGL